MLFVSGFRLFALSQTSEGSREDGAHRKEKWMEERVGTDKAITTPSVVLAVMATAVKAAARMGTTGEAYDLPIDTLAGTLASHSRVPGFKSWFCS